MIIPEELQGDLAGWRFMKVYRVQQPCAHGACCDIDGYYAERRDAEAAVRRLFGNVASDAYGVLIDSMTMLTRDGRSGFLLGSDALRDSIETRGAHVPSGPPALRLV